MVQSSFNLSLTHRKVFNFLESLKIKLCKAITDVVNENEIEELELK